MFIDIHLSAVIAKIRVKSHGLEKTLMSILKS